MVNFPFSTGQIPGYCGPGTYETKLYSLDYEILVDSNGEFKIWGNKRLAALRIVKFIEQKIIEMDYSTIGFGPLVFYKKDGVLTVENNMKNSDDLELIQEMIDIINKILCLKAFL